jgi:hypothetical protein
MKKMNSWLHGFLLLIAVALSYFWLQIQVLSYYSLQAFAMAVVMYFVIKKIHQKQLNLKKLMPAHTSLEMVFATFAFLLLIGATGNIESPFYALTYVHLFLLVFTSNYKTSSLVASSIMLFHISLSPLQSNELITSILSLPIVYFFFLFAKTQYDEVLREKEIIESDELVLSLLEKDKLKLQSFLSKFLLTKITQLKSIVQEPQVNLQTILGQLTIIEVEIERKLSQLRISQRAIENDKNQAEKKVDEIQ